MQPLKPHLNAEELARQFEALQNLFKENCEESVFLKDSPNDDVRKSEVILAINKAVDEWYRGMGRTYHNIYTINWRIIDNKFPVVELLMQVQINFDKELYNLAVTAEVK